MFAASDAIQPVKWAPFGKEGKCSSAPFALPVGNFYMTDPVTRASKVMAECAKVFLKPKKAKAVAHG